MKKNNVKIRTIAVIGIMSAIAVVLQFLEFPIPLMPSFIKFDFSDLPGLITAFAFGPIAGILVSLLKNVIHLLVTQSGGVGDGRCVPDPLLPAHHAHPSGTGAAQRSRGRVTRFRREKSRGRIPCIHVFASISFIRRTAQKKGFRSLAKIGTPV